MKKKFIGAAFAAGLFAVLSFQSAQAASPSSYDIFKGEILQHLQNQDTDFSIQFPDRNGSGQISNAFQDAMNSDDYIHYIISSCKYTWVEDSSTNVSFHISYLEDKKQVEYVDSQVQKIISQIIKPGMNDYQKERVIHDYVVSHVTYDKSLKKFTDYDALSSGQSVCLGVSLLTYKLLKSVDIPVRIVNGTATGGILHAWNLVKIDGSWYHLDCTWDEPVDNTTGKVQYRAYNLTDAQIGADHKWANVYPEANTNFLDVLKTKNQSDSANATDYTDLARSISSMS